MSAVLESVVFDHELFETELAALETLLESKADLSERDDIQPLFKASKHLSAFLGTFDPGIGPATHLAYEFPFFGDYRADLLVGSRSAAHFCVIEFEDGRTNSIFKNQSNRSNPEWSPRFEHGFSQLIDWFFSLDDLKRTHSFTKTFGYGHISFTGLLIIGRSAGLDPMKRTRLRWRSDRVVVDSNKIVCLTFDDAVRFLHQRYASFKAAIPGEPMANGPAKPPPESLF